MSSYKVIFTVPEDEANKLRQAIGNVGGGKIGNYIHCSFSIKGVGRFKPVEGANPTIGEVGQLESVVEERIEITCDDTNLSAVIRAICDNHSYEEPVIDVYRLESKPE